MDLRRLKLPLCGTALRLDINPHRLLTIRRFRTRQEERLRRRCRRICRIFKHLSRDMQRQRMGRRMGSGRRHRWRNRRRCLSHRVDRGRRGRRRMHLERVGRDHLRL